MRHGLGSTQMEAGAAPPLPPRYGRGARPLCQHADRSCEARDEASLARGPGRGRDEAGTRPGRGRNEAGTRPGRGRDEAGTRPGRGSGRGTGQGRGARMRTARAMPPPSAAPTPGPAWSRIRDSTSCRIGLPPPLLPAPVPGLEAAARGGPSRVLGAIGNKAAAARSADSASTPGAHARKVKTPSH